MFDWLFGKKVDNREPYIRNEYGQVLTLRVEGDLGSGEVHKRYIHRNIPHQNPTIDQDRVWVKGWLFGGHWEYREVRHYPITDNGVDQVDVLQLAREIEAKSERRGEKVSLVWATSDIEQRLNVVENDQQFRRGVALEDLPVGRINGVNRVL